jgi:transcriptional regulator with XRE-family HTH domain
MEAIITIDYSSQPMFGVPFYVVELSLTIELIQHSVIQWKIEKEIILMTPEQTVQLINLLSKKRAEAGLSNNEVARRADVDPGTVWRIEQGQIPTPKAESLKAIGDVLGIPALDLFAIVGWIPSDELPSIGPYLRAKYRELPGEAVQEIETHFQAVARKYGVSIEGNDRPLNAAASTPSDTLHSPKEV